MLRRQKFDADSSHLTLARADKVLLWFVFVGMFVCYIITVFVDSCKLQLDEETVAAINS